ncbi:MAG: AlpA family phage regulatory protein [Candidatus Sedimenticola sp. (ex Thyasira tokunagai)]
MAKLIPLKAACDKAGYGKSKTYSDIGEGTFPEPVKRGRSSRWVEHEIDVVIKARIAGKTDDEIRVLVAKLHNERMGEAS